MSIVVLNTHLISTVGYFFKEFEKYCDKSDSHQEKHHWHRDLKLVSIDDDYTAVRYKIYDYEFYLTREIKPFIRYAVLKTYKFEFSTDTFPEKRLVPVANTDIRVNEQNIHFSHSLDKDDRPISNFSIEYLTRVLLAIKNEEEVFKSIDQPAQ
jgi:hypothetical protein